MQAYDLIMLVVLAMATIFGAIKGFAWQVASLASVIVSYLVAYNFRYDLAEMIQATPPWNLFLAMLILYVGTSFAIWVGFRVFSGMIDRVRLKEFDRHLGAGFGFAKGLIYCLLITMFAMSLLGQNQQRAICQSKSGYYIAQALDKGVGILPKEVHDVVGPYLANLDDKLKNGQTGPEPENIDWQDLRNQGSQVFGQNGTLQNEIGQTQDRMGQELQGFGNAIQDGLGNMIQQGVQNGVSQALEGFQTPSRLQPQSGMPSGNVGTGNVGIQGSAYSSSGLAYPNQYPNSLRPTEQASQPNAVLPR